jgi:hypothetical protein
LLDYGPTNSHHTNREDSGMAKMKGARHMREWSAGDMKKLRQFAKQKVSARVAAQKLGRSPGAVRYKAMMEGVSFRSINRKK